MNKEKITTIYKLTDKNLQTSNAFQWEIGKWYKTSGKGELCGDGWLHAYHSPDLAILLNPSHADIEEKTMRLFRAEGRGKSLDDKGLKVGFSQMRIVEEIDKPKWTTTQRVAFGLLCAMEVCKNEAWRKWAQDWLSGKDRMEAAAIAVEAAAEGTNQTLDFTDICARARMVSEADASAVFPAGRWPFVFGEP